MRTAVVFLVLLSVQLVPTEGCGDPARECLTDEASCVDGVCTCNGGVPGNGYLGCHSGTKMCTIINDPTLRSFKGSGVDLPVPCRYHAVEYTARYDTAATDGWRCYIKVAGFNERIKGKIFVKGMDVNVTYVYGAGDSLISHKYLLRAKGQYSDSEYQFERTIFNPATQVAAQPLESDTYTMSFLPYDQDITFKFSDVDYRVILSIPFCALEVYFRPANPAEGMNQTYVPGFSIAVSDEDHVITWGNADENTLCLTSDPNGATVASTAAALGLSVADAFLYLAFVRSDHHIFPGASPLCGQIMDLARTCTDVDTRKKGLKTCSFLLKEPTFVNCWESGTGTDSDTILTLFKGCFESVCNGDTDECTRLTNQVLDHDCVTHLKDETVTMLENDPCDF